MDNNMTPAEIAAKYQSGQMFLIQEAPRGPSQLIEVVVDANGQSSISFPDVPQLRNDTSQVIIIKALRVIPPTVMSVAVKSAAAVAPITELVKMSLVLYSQGWNKGQNIPVLTLVDVFIEGSGTPWKNRTTQLANWINVDWNKSVVQLGNGAVTAGAPYTIVFEVEYVKLNKEGMEIVGPG